MAASIKKVRQAFTDLYVSSFDPVFRKTIRLDKGNEKEHLPFVRFFLLGFFGALEPERQTYYPGCKTGWGKFDFMIDNTAVEFAVRMKNHGKGAALEKANKSEIIKLMKYKGKSILVIFDYSAEPLSKYDLNAYRKLPSLGKGKHNKYPLNLLYLYREDKEIRSHFLNIQTAK